MLLSLKCRWMAARLVETIKLQVLGAKKKKWGERGGSQGCEKGVARGASTPLAVEKQSGERSGDRPSLVAVAPTRQAWAGKSEGEPRSLSIESRVRLGMSM